jgi:hypothetical protein
MEELPRILRSLALLAASCLLLNLPFAAQTNAGLNSQPQQPLLPTAFDTAAVKKALAHTPSDGLVASMVDQLNSVKAAKAVAVAPKVCATPLLESEADPNIDLGIHVVPSKQDEAGSRVKTLTDPISVPPPVPACAAAKR